MAQTAFREEEFSFRFTGLTPNTARHLRERLTGLEMESRIPEVVSLPLRAGTDYGPLLEFLASEHLDPATYSIWASVVTSSDHGGISLPTHVLEIVRETLAGVDFSFVACTDG